MRQLLVDSLPAADGTLTLRGSQYRYVRRVLRKGAGDSLECRFVDGSLSFCTVLEVDDSRKSITLSVSEGGIPQAEPGYSQSASSLALDNFPRLVLLQWILKGQKMDLVIRQATEAGVMDIIPVVGDRSIPEREVSSRSERWLRIVREARQQSGSAVPTTIHPATMSSAIVDVSNQLLSGESPTRLVFTEAPLALKSLHQYLDSGPATVVLAIGPEGGMSPAELTALGTAGFNCVHFKTNILRAETCALYAVAATLSALTERDTWQLKEYIC